MAIECLDALMNQTRSEDPIYDSPAKSPFLQAMLNVECCQGQPRKAGFNRVNVELLQYVIS